MTHTEGEHRIKSLQKRFLGWVEDHEYLHALPPAEFNRIRRKAFSSTFEAFRLGRVGLGVTTQTSLWVKFFGWASIAGLPHEVEFELQAMCFLVSLEAFRVGALVTGAEEQNAIQH